MSPTSCLLTISRPYVLAWKSCAVSREAAHAHGNGEGQSDPAMRPRPKMHIGHKSGR